MKVFLILLLYSRNFFVWILWFINYKVFRVYYVLLYDTSRLTYISYTTQKKLKTKKEPCRRVEGGGILPFLSSRSKKINQELPHLYLKKCSEVLIELYFSSWVCLFTFLTETPQYTLFVNTYKFLIYISCSGLS